MSHIAALPGFEPVLILALDRIIGLEESTARYIKSKGFDVGTFFHDVIGVTVNQNARPVKVVLQADHQTAPYILTKPLHHSQQITKSSTGHVIFTIEVQLNFELEREILGFGDGLKVLAPDRLKKRIVEQLEKALEEYN